MNNIVPVKRALLSVSDKNGLIEFAQGLTSLGVEIISTGGTSKTLADANIPHRQVDDLTGLPAMLDGRVKTLHPKVHGGILGLRDKHKEEAAKHELSWIDLVVVNFYPFATGVTAESTWAEAVEYIDIGGPTMVRAAAKNMAWVGVVTDPNDYSVVIETLKEQQGLDRALRQRLAAKVFALTSRYDAMVHDYFQRQIDSEAVQPDILHLQLQKHDELRYGENPHQRAYAYQLGQTVNGIFSAQQHQGKPLSYNNMLDAEAAWHCVSEFVEPAAVIVKHANPCGAATGKSIAEAYKRAYEADPMSAFGGIIALNRECTQEIAETIAPIFMEVVLAPSFTAEALTILAAKPNLRVLSMPVKALDTWEMKFISGGVLMQEKDITPLDEASLQVVTATQPSADDMSAMLFAWRVLKHVKSNGILVAKQNTTVGVGAGQVSRIDAVDLAVRKAGKTIDGAILASDAFFPFRDGIDRLKGTGVRAIIQPGGSVRDEEVIAACNELGIAMVFTGKRCFKH